MSLLPLASLALVAAWTLAPAPRTDEIEFVWKYSKESTLEWALEIETSRSIETELTINGNPADFPNPGAHVSTRRLTVRHRDEIRDVAKGLPTRVRRTYGEISLDTTFGDEEGEPLTSPLVDRTIGLDASGKELALELPEDLDLTDEQREAITLQPRLGAFLPAGKVAIGASWELDRKALIAVLNYGANLYDLPEKRTIELPDGDTMEVPDPRRIAMVSQEEAWEGECTLSEVEEVEGVRVAVVTVEATLERRSRGGDDIQAEGGAILIRAGDGEGEETLEGTLRFDLTNGRVLSLDLEGEIDLVSGMENETEMGLFEMVSTTTGERRVSLRVKDVR